MRIAEEEKADLHAMARSVARVAAQEASWEALRGEGSGGDTTKSSIHGVNAFTTTMPTRVQLNLYAEGLPEPSADGPQHSYHIDPIGVDHVYGPYDLRDLIVMKRQMDQSVAGITTRRCST
ncbi:hypothetical protein NFJ02_07g130840 [Pycnococcus provasolii]